MASITILSGHMSSFIWREFQFNYAVLEMVLKSEANSAWLSGEEYYFVGDLITTFIPN